VIGAGWDLQDIMLELTSVLRVVLPILSDWWWRLQLWWLYVYVYYCKADRPFCKLLTYGGANLTSFMGLRAWARGWLLQGRAIGGSGRLLSLGQALTYAPRVTTPL